MLRRSSPRCARSSGATKSRSPPHEAECGSGALGRRSRAEVAIDRDAVDYIDVELADGRQQPVTSGSRSPESRLGVRSRSVGESVNLILHPGGRYATDTPWLRHDHASQTAAAFLAALIDAVPYSIHTVLPDNGCSSATCLRVGQAHNSNDVPVFLDERTAAIVGLNRGRNLLPSANYLITGNRCNAAGRTIAT